MDYMTMLNRVAYENAMIKSASRLQKKATEGEDGGKEDKKDTGKAEAAGKKIDEAASTVGQKVSEGWDAVKNWAANNKQGLIGAGTAAAVAPAMHYGLNQIPWFKQRRLLNYLTSGLTAAAAGGAAAQFGPGLLAKKEEKPAEEPKG